jgi:8-oxo-dGTP diphosphatase
MNSQIKKRPHIGVGVMVWNGDRLLLGKRISAHSENSWQFPGGHLEFGETVEDCARREVEEEAGIVIRNIVPGGFTNDVFIDAEKHYVTLFVTAEHEAGEPEVMEPEKCEHWQWFKWNELPEPLFLPIRNFLKQHPDLSLLRYRSGTQAGAHK